MGCVGSEWIRGLGLGFTNHVGTGRVWELCLCLGCGGVGFVGEEWLAGLGQGLGNLWCYNCVCFESGLFV